MISLAKVSFLATMGEMLSLCQDGTELFPSGFDACPRLVRDLIPDSLNDNGVGREETP